MPMPASKRLVMPFGSICRSLDCGRNSGFPLDSTAEVSRFAISRQFRQRSVDGSYPGESDGSAPSACGRQLSHGLSIGLIVAITQLGLSNGITTLCAVMDPSLLRLLYRLGIEFHPIGPPVNYHGIRQPCFADCAALLRQLHGVRPDYWDLIENRDRLVRPSVARPLDKAVPALA